MCLIEVGGSHRYLSLSTLDIGGQAIRYYIAIGYRRKKGMPFFYDSLWQYNTSILSPCALCLLEF